MSRFHEVYDKINQALNELPYENLGISEEVKEQVDCFDSLQNKKKNYA